MANNPLFSLLNSGVPQNLQGTLTRFQQFKQMFRGDPKTQVQQLLNSGRVSQAQYNRAVQMANELQKYIQKP